MTTAASIAILGMTEEGNCEHCGACCPRRRVNVLVNGSRQAWGVVCVANATRKTTTKVVNAAESSDTAAKRAVESKMARVADSKTDANVRYTQTRRPLVGSYFAQRGDQIVRVDGADSNDVAFFAAAGFCQVTAAVAA